MSFSRFAARMAPPQAIPQENLHRVQRALADSRISVYNRIHSI